MKRSLPPFAPPVDVRATPPPPEEGVVSWNMNTTCNLRCSYCTQRFVEDRGRWARDLPRFLDAFGALPAASGVPWEIKLSGGEPFAHPGFLDVVGGLRERGLFVSVVTNFSYRDAVPRFIAAAGDKLRVLSCSLHLEYVGDDGGRESVASFIQRCVDAQAQLPREASLVVTCVATRAALPTLAALRERFVNAGVSFKVQPEKQDREVIAYDDDERALLVRLGGHNGTGRIAADFLGQPCWAGARYFIVDDGGEAFRCYPARRYRVERLGNVVDGTFRLGEAASPCRYAYCNCTVPIARGMMPVEAGVERLVERDRTSGARRLAILEGS